MVPEIGEGYLSMDTAQDIWEAVATMYSRKGNFSQTFELRRSIDRFVQGEMTILQYFTFLSNGWKRLDHLQDYKPVCPTDSAGYRKFVEQVRVFKFLEGLNVEFDPVRSRVLGMDTLPSLQEAFAYVQNEESHGDHGSRPPSEKDTLFCDFCRRPHHTCETCWKLHGQPSGGRGDRSSSRGGRSGQARGRGPNARAHHSDTVEPQSTAPVDSFADISGFSTSELEVALRHLLDRRASSSSSGNIAQSGNLASSTSAFLSHQMLPWIIDSGASDHMSGSSDLFSAYTPSSGQDKVRIADGTISSVSGKGPYHEEDDWQW
ncbi:uncharacterized protein LOC114284582 [Camellia sinensis]|uniref:uncharacterized protein LOC114284582 n=1 Tax=Camellia sinensis TaxID=4442 RepID=UPI001035D6D1|nr:uncharacterized protein LOC114284582 [Camellia sinensis]